ncbi:hypothetical protein L602_002500000200 [Cupriavidus gilardii J11]|uniref:Uncharacterized protein n=1 Tax=Cupriavidus gilardii J11 TaxID=936133 RepID=A0A562BKJ2_9BURK|nr:hypothetical protein [Cupriavidus gilardii]TWG85419.1 hypothetical protein L602_002500000200 [Cupriavidus gilardii J11]
MPSFDSCIASPSHSDARRAAGRAPPPAAHAVSGARNPPTMGQFVINGTQHSIALDVSVSTDGYSLSKRVYYALWALNCVGRLVADCLPKFKIEFLAKLESLRDSGTGEYFKIMGIGFAMLEGAIASYDFYKAIRRFFKARAELTPEKLQAHDDAKAKLRNFTEQRIAAKARSHAAAVLDADPAAPARDEETYAESDPDARLPPERRNNHGDQIDMPEDNNDIAVHDAMRMAIPVPVASDIFIATLEPTADECSAYLKVVWAKCEKEMAQADFFGSGIAWGRDFVAQGFRSSWDLACEVAKFCGQNLASGVSYVGTALIAVGHIAAGVYDHRQANKVIKAAQIAIAASEERRSEASGRHRADRVNSGYATAIFDSVQYSRKSQSRFGERLKSWANLRITYGGFSVLLACAGILASILLTGSAFATGGLILIPIALTIGSIWLGHAVQKGHVRNSRNAAMQADRLVVEKVLAALNQDAQARGEMTYDRLEDWPPGILHTLLKSAELESNGYLAAAVAAKWLTSKQLPDSGDQSETNKLKKKRLRTSAALQTLGMPKSLTSMLKRGHFQDGLNILTDYMNGELKIHSHCPNDESGAGLPR